jgi:hypothetical protein
LRGKIIVHDFKGKVEAASPDAAKSIAYLAAESQMKMHDIHSRAMGCMCECFGLNTEAMAGNEAINKGHYRDVMRKWELVNEEGELLI